MASEHKDSEDWFDFDSWASKYSGEGKALRLAFVAKSSTQFAERARELAIQTVREQGYRTNLYRELNQPNDSASAADDWAEQTDEQVGKQLRAYERDLDKARDVQNKAEIWVRITCREQAHHHAQCFLRKA